MKLVLKSSIICFGLLSFMHLSNLQAQNFSWVKSLGGTSSDEGKSITIDASGNVYTTGLFSDTVDFDPGPGLLNLISAGNSDIFITKLDGSGNLVWAKSMKGGGFGQGTSIAVDISGNVYTTGFFTGTVDWDPGAGIQNLTSEGGEDIFISKIDSSGNFVWAKTMGGTNLDRGKSIAIDASGNVYTTGVFENMGDFDPGAGLQNLTSAGGWDIFISKLDSSGNFIWAKSLGGTGFDQGQGITADAAGNVYTTGYFSGTADFDPGAGVENLTSAGSADIFISTLDISGNLVWAKRMGGTGYDQGNSIVLDAYGNLCTTGSFLGTADFDPGTGLQNLTSVASDDIFISKLDASGNFIWAKSMGGTGWDSGKSIAVDGLGHVYITGYFESIADFDPGAGLLNLTSAGNKDIFISTLDVSGNLVWAKSIGGINWDEGLSVAVDLYGYVYTTGFFQDTADFDPGVGLQNLTSSGNRDVFISTLNQNQEVGINHYFLSNLVRLYPNPAAEIVTLELQSKTQETFQILDLQGKVVLQGILIQGKNLVNISLLAKGSYLLRTQESSGMIFEVVK